jgi:hypothetical protein
MEDVYQSSWMLMKEGPIIETAASIEKDMEVFTSGGNSLGKITQVWPQVGDQTIGITTAGYFAVHEGGLLGVGGKDLYIPFTAVDDLVAHKSITLGCTKGECEKRYSETPDFLT